MKKKEFKMVMKVESWEFNWRFWRPIQCIGGKVFFGRYANCLNVETGETSKQTVEQVCIKRQMGICAMEVNHFKNLSKNTRM